MDFVFEILFELYIELMMLIVPEEKATSKKYRALTIAFATVVLFGLLALFIWGFVLISDYGNMLGLIPISVSAVLSIAQILAGFILYGRKSG